MKTIITAIATMSIVAMSSLAAIAGDRTGNGGNAVVCYTDTTKKEIKSVELFDFWEKAQQYPEFGKFDLGSPSLSVKEKLETFFSRMRDLNERATPAVQEYASLIYANIDSYMQDSVPTIDDDLSDLKPVAPCYKEQLAIQIANPDNKSRRFRVHKGLYLNPKTSNDVRAGLILHEAIYRAAILSYGDENSERARLFNFFLATNAAQSFHKYPKLIDKVSASIQLNFDVFKVMMLGASPAMLLLKKDPSEFDTIYTALNDFAYVDEKLEVKISSGTKTLCGKILTPAFEGHFYCLPTGEDNVLFSPYGKVIHTVTYSPSQVFYFKHRSDLQPSSIRFTFAEDTEISGSFGKVTCKQKTDGSFSLEDYSFQYCAVTGDAFFKTPLAEFSYLNPFNTSVSVRNGQLAGILRNSSSSSRGCRNDELKMTVSLNSVFSKNLLDFKICEDLRFRKDGLVTEGSFLESFEFSFERFSAHAFGFRWIEGNQFVALKPDITVFPLYRTPTGTEVPILNADGDFWHRLCPTILQIPESDYRGFDWEVKTELVGNTQSFFDLETLKVVQKKDEPVTYFDPKVSFVCRTESIPFIKN